MLLLKARWHMTGLTVAPYDGATWLLHFKTHAAAPPNAAHNGKRAHLSVSLLLAHINAGRCNAARIPR